MEKIDIKHKIKLTGKYNAGVYTCPECNTDLLENQGGLYKHVIGFADSNQGNMTVVECPVCFTKWHFHSRIHELSNHYFYFLEFVKEGLNIHFKS